MAQTTISLRPRQVDLVDRVWRVASSVRLGLTLIGLVAACTFIGTLVPQASNAGLYDAVAYANWLDFQRERFGVFGSLVTLFDALGLFNIFQSWYFRVLLVALAMSVALGGILNRVPRIWRGAMHLPPIRVGERLFEVHESARHVAADAAPAAARAALTGALRARRYRVVDEIDGDRTYVYADKHRFGIFGTFVSHTGLILVLLGALVGSVFGWRDDVFTITDGSTRPIGFGTDLAVRNDLFVDEYDPATGQPSDFYTDAVLLRRAGDGWEEIRRHRIRVNDPLDHNGVVVHQAFFGPATVLQVKDNQGNVMFRDGVAMPWRNPDGRPLGWVDIPAGRFPIPLSVFIIGRVPGGPAADPAIKPGQVAVEVYPAGRATPDTLLFRQLLDLGTPAVLMTPTGRPLLEFTFERERQFTGLNLSYNPGLPLIWTACVLMLVGWSAVFYFPHRRVRAVVAPGATGGSRVSSAFISRLDLGAHREHESITGDVAARLRAATLAGAPAGISQPDLIV
ncbi:MAG: cytochrome c biogenesis protein ResB [Chloroflexi bacterium]|nr:cytochrome c biogenesis protein ResB [Chloroflexota bacterium]